MQTKFIFTLFILLVLPPLWAEGGVLTLNEAITELLQANPDAQAAHYQVEAAKARIPQAKALEDPRVGVMFEDVPIDTAHVTQGEEINYRLEQTFPFPGKRYVRGKAARLEAESVAATSEGKIQDLLLDLKKTYYDLYRLNHLLKLNEENQQLLSQLLGSATASYATGKTTAATPLKAQVELTKLKNERLQLEQERVMHQAHLKALLNRSGHGDVRLPDELDWPRLTDDLETMVAKATETRPELKSLEAMEKRDRARLTAARQGLLPDLSLGAEYNQRPGRGDAWTGTAMVNLPVFFWKKNRGEMREAKASLLATRAESESMNIHTRHEIEQSYSAVRALAEIVAAYQNNLLPQARTMLHAARAAYASGKSDFLTLIDAARTTRDLEASYYENQSRLGIAFAELERVSGIGDQP